MRVLVTGGAGFIGSHIVDHLLEEGHDVSVVDNLSSGKEDRIPAQVTFYRTGLRDAALPQAISDFRPECVVHQAAQVNVSRSVEDPFCDADTNVLGTLHLLEQCRRFDVRKVIFASSAAVYGEPVALPIDEQHRIGPLSPYGVSKLTVEHYLSVYRSLYGLEYTVLRYANVYGPRQDAHGEGGVVAIFAHRIAHGEGVVVHGNGDQTRDLVYVADVARANGLALHAGDGEIINVSFGQETSINELLAELGAAAGREIRAEYGPPRSGDIFRSLLANDRARHVLGWTPRVTLREGLRACLDHERAHLS